MPHCHQQINLRKTCDSVFPCLPLDPFQANNHYNVYKTQSQANQNDFSSSLCVFVSIVRIVPNLCVPHLVWMRSRGGNGKKEFFLLLILFD
jgi:hypothetical protein